MKRVACKRVALCPRRNIFCSSFLSEISPPFTGPDHVFEYVCTKTLLLVHERERVLSIPHLTFDFLNKHTRFQKNHTSETFENASCSNGWIGLAYLSAGLFRLILVQTHTRDNSSRGVITRLHYHIEDATKRQQQNSHGISRKSASNWKREQSPWISWKVNALILIPNCHQRHLARRCVPVSRRRVPSCKLKRKKSGKQIYHFIAGQWKILALMRCASAICFYQRPLAFSSATALFQLSSFSCHQSTSVCKTPLHVPTTSKIPLETCDQAVCFSFFPHSPLRWTVPVGYTLIVVGVTNGTFSSLCPLWIRSNETQSH